MLRSVRGRRVPVFVKLFGMAGVLLALIVIVGVIGITRLGSVNDRADALSSDAVRSLQAMSVYGVAMDDQQRLALRGVVLMGDAAGQRKVDQSIAAAAATAKTSLAKQLSGTLFAAERPLMSRLRTEQATFLKARDEVRATTKAGDRTAALAAVDRAVAAYEKLALTVAADVKINSDQANLMHAEIDSAYRSSRLLIIVLVAVALIVGLGLAFVVSRSIRRSVADVLDRLRSLSEHCISGLRSAIGALAEGRLTVTVEPQTTPIERITNDELGDTAREVNTIRETVVSTIESYNDARGSLSTMLTQVSASAGAVSASSQEMASTSEEAGRAVGEIANAIGEVAAGAERQVRMVGTTRASAQETADAAEETQRVAQEGAAAAERATGAMGAVRASSQEVSEAIQSLSAKSDEIGGIVSTITGIAEQTNLLALNAAIEAARAGEQGRGFAVVAEEVRKLAEESSSAAATIGSLIDQIQAETTRAVDVVESGAQRSDEGANIVEEARAAFEQIAASVRDVSGRIEQIAESANEVAVVAEQSSASTEEVSASTEETSASTQQIAASAQELARTAEELQALVGRFELARA